jgi:hypothetical protein
LLLDLGLGEAGAVHPVVHDLDRLLHLGRFRGAATGLDRLQRHGGAAGEVQAQVNPEVAGPLPGAGQISADDRQDHHHDDAGQQGQHPARP